MTVKETISVWLKAARAPFLIVSFIPAVLGGIIAYYNGYFDWTIFVLATIGIVMAHSAGDFVDDYFDYINGNLGNKEQQFHDSPLISGKVTLRQVLIATIICLAIAGGIGIYLLFEIGMPVLYLMLAGTFIVLFYTSPPVRLNYRGLGETALFFAFGPMIVVGIYYVLTGTITWEPVFASLPLGIFTMNVGIVSNTFDYEDDIKNGKRCIPVRFGQPFAVRLVIIGTVLAYLSITAGVLLGFMPVWSLISLATIPLAIGVIVKTSKFHDTSNYTSAMGMAIGLTTIMGIMMVGGYII
jgi:1,4-dihydroxy-2-naphthoate octaprenyltransferase